MPNTGKKRLRKQDKGYLRRRTHTDIDLKVTTLNGESAKELVIRRMHSARQAVLVFY